MSTDDPFSLAGSDRTIIMPTPGGRGAGSRKPASTAAVRESFQDEPVDTGGMNPLVAAANPLLNVVAQLRVTVQHPDPTGLRDFLAQSIRTFEARAQAAGVSREKIIAARYALCTLLDEAAASTPWGGSGIWARHSLLVMFHNEAWGGEKFFQLLSKLAEDPATNRDLLELMYVCLSLGLKGRYQVVDDGKAALDGLRERLASMIRRQQGEYERSLSPHWQGVRSGDRGLFSALPLWIALGALALVLIGGFFLFSYALNEQSNPVFAKVQALRVQPASPPPIKVAAPAAKPRLAGLLAPEIGRGLVAVVDEDNRSVVTLRGDGLFAAGSATISPEYLAPLERIAEALQSQPGQVRVIGHTDNQPIRWSPRFPSNWHLSQERARVVTALLRERSRTPERFTYEGRGDTEPLGPNGNPAERALNRRVEIVLSAVPGGR